MTHSEVSNLVQFSVNTLSQVKVFLKLRTPIIGRFVCLSDSKDLSQKGMIRFVSARNEDGFAITGKTMHTRIFVASDITDILKINSGC